MSAGNGIRFPRIHAAESVRQRILATFEELGGVVPGEDPIGLAGAGMRVGEPYVPGSGVGASVGMDQALIGEQIARARTPATGSGSATPDPQGGVGPDPHSMAVAGQSVMTGGNLVDALGRG